MPLELGLANAHYHLGEDAQADKIYRRYEKNGILMPEGAHNIAHMMIRNGRNTEEVEKLLKTASTGPTTPHILKQVELTRAEAAIMEDDMQAATAILDKLDPENLDPVLLKRFSELSRLIRES
jgi:hypothetical protein